MERGTKIVVELLASGMPTGEVAETVGCTSSAVSQVADAYSEAIAQRALEMKHTANSPVGSEGSISADIDSRLDSLEHTILEKIEKTLPLETNLMKLSKVFQTINGAKRRSRNEGLPQGAVVNNTQVVALTLPEHISRSPKYKTNSQGQIIEVDGTVLETASESFVNKLAGVAEENKDELPQERNSEKTQKTLTQESNS